MYHMFLYFNVAQKTLFKSQLSLFSSRLIWQKIPQYKFLHKPYPYSSSVGVKVNLFSLLTLAPLAPNFLYWFKALQLTLLIAAIFLSLSDRKESGRTTAE